MLHQIVCAGFGGQGVMLLGQVLAYAGMLEGKEVSWYPSYGPEMRGGTANCTTVISDSVIGSPVVSNPTALIVMNQPSLEKFKDRVEPGGLLLYNSSLVSEYEPKSGIRAYPIDAGRVAAELGNPKVANIVVLGALLALAKPVTVSSAKKALEMVLPARRHHLLSLNYAALEKGVELVD
ncbi:MAG: 2-oxoacid:acceptor oxidoreductase family protein [Firmicutes bacterium]|nr:2-oxoacid:acceptor oxidoreductase family protein [Bacillota bacterium]